MESKNQITTPELLNRALNIQVELSNVKPLYGELDLIILELVNRKVFEFEIDGKKYLIADNFESKNTVFRPAGVKRYELKEVKAA